MLAARNSKLSVTARDMAQRMMFCRARNVLKVFVLIAAGLHFQTAAMAQYPAVRLTAVSPPSGQRGTSLDVTIAGTDLEEAHRLLFSHSGIKATQKTTPADQFRKTPRPVANQFSVEISADVPPGVYECRVAGLFGISNPRFFVVGAAEELREKSPNNRLEDAQPIKLGGAVTGTSDSDGRDFYKFSAKKGSRVLIHCQAYRIDSRMDATLVLFNPQGKEIARNRDTFRRDPFLDVTIPTDGEYVIEIHDFLYKGSNEHFYRISLNTRPHIDFVFPPVGVAGMSGKFDLYGRNLPGGTLVPTMKIDGRPLEKITVNIAIPSNAGSGNSSGLYIGANESGLDRFVYRLPSGQKLSNPVAIGLATAPVIRESDANDNPTKAQKVTLPCEIAGQFYPRGDKDYFTFDAKKGEEYWIEIYSQRLGAASDPYLLLQRITEKDGKQQATLIVALDDTAAAKNGPNPRVYQTASDDSSYRLVVPADGTYRIMVRDLHYRSRENPRFLYRLAIRNATPDFRLVAVAEKPDTNVQRISIWNPLVRKGGTTVMRVLALRQDGFDGEIRVSVEGLPAGVDAKPVTIGRGAQSAPLVFVATEQAQTWFGRIRIRGEATISGQPRERIAGGGSVVWGAANAQQSARSRYSAETMLAVAGSESDFALIKVGDGQPIGVSRAGKLAIPVKMTRRNGFKGNVAIKPAGLPSNLKANNIALNGTATDGKLQITVPNNMPPGTYSFVLTGQTKVPYRRNPQAIERAKKEQTEVTAIAAKIDQQAKQATAAKQAADKHAADMTTMMQKAAQALAAVSDKMKKSQTQNQTSATKLAQAQAATKAKPADAALKTALAAAEKEDAATKAALAKTTAEQAAAAAVVKDAQAKVASATTAKGAADKKAAQTAAQAKQAIAAKAAAAKRVTDATNVAKPKNIDVLFVSTSVTIKVTETPIEVTIGQPTSPLTPSAKVEIPVTIKRLYGFKDPVSVMVYVPKGLSGVTVGKVTIAAGQTEGKLVLQAAKNAKPGEYTFSAAANMKVNGQNLKSTSTFNVTIAPEAKKVIPTKTATK